MAVAVWCLIQATVAAKSSRGEPWAARAERTLSDDMGAAEDCGGEREAVGGALHCALNAKPVADFSAKAQLALDLAEQASIA